MKPPVQDDQEVWKVQHMSLAVPQVSSIQHSLAMQKRGEIPCDTMNANYNAWCACLNCLLFCCMTHLILKTLEQLFYWFE